MNFMPPKIHKNLAEVRARSTAPLILFVVLCFVCRTEAASTATPGSLESTARFISHFAIADFDGDRKPDLATVEVEARNSSRTARYSIRFQLTEGIAQLFVVTGPSGGLRIVARDLNGDDALDLLVSSAWQHEQIAVLLNDGHGNFTLADPGAFPAASQENGRNWNSVSVPLFDNCVLVRFENASGEIEGKCGFDGLREKPGRVYIPATLGSALLLLFPILGRAPPTVAFQS